LTIIQIICLDVTTVSTLRLDYGHTFVGITFVRIPSASLSDSLITGLKFVCMTMIVIVITIIYMQQLDLPTLMRCLQKKPEWGQDALKKSEEGLPEETAAPDEEEEEEEEE